MEGGGRLAGRVPARLTAAEGRNFGLTVGAAFLVLATLMWWRDHQAMLISFAAIGLLLVVGGTVVPTRLGPVFRAWMGLAHAISKVTNPIFMGVVYFLVLTPIALAIRVLGRNPLRRKERDGSFWVDRTLERHRRGSMHHQF